MRAGGCALQQSLTAEAASVVKQAVALANRRGHAQVTPLHVANTMLAASAGLLRKACLQSHSHPLQCRALELCFNVALNRLPASSSNPMLGPHSQGPSISNALLAAFKRAQAHQRRGSIENQQQPLLAVKIELEQLIISILDDPSVSRVMREAGFSSTKVKSNVEQAISLELRSQAPPSGNNKSNGNNLSALSQPSSKCESLVKVRKPSASDHAVQKEDIISLIGSFMNRRKKSIVIVGQCIESIESVVGGLMEGNVPEALREVKFISVSSLFSNHRREEVEQKIGELTCLVRSLLAKGVVLYLGDLKWVVDCRDSYREQIRRNYYCPVEHMIMELGRLVFTFGESGNFRLMGIATFQTYMRCRAGHNSLESVWCLHPLTVPSGTLELSLIPDSDNQGDSMNKKAENGSLVLEKGAEEKQLNCCADCSAKFEAEVRNLPMIRCNSESTLSSLPSWLKDDIKSFNSNDQRRASSVKELREKWNSICNAVHKQPKSLERALTFPTNFPSSSSPSSSNSCFSYDQPYCKMPQNLLPSCEPTNSWRDHQQYSTAALHNTASKTSFQTYIPPAQAFSLNPIPIHNSSSSSDTMEMEYVQRFKEFNAENLNILCEAMEKKVPWQKEIISEIAGTILQCRSGMLRRKSKLTSGSSEAKQETWFIFQGQDALAKEQIARELARTVFGSYSNFESIAMSSFSYTRTDSSEDLRNKRSRDEQSCSYTERFAQAAAINPHRVFFMEDVEQADSCSQKGMKRAIEKGRITNLGGEEVSLGDAIIILSCESFDSRSRACSPSVKQKLNGPEEEKSTKDYGEACPVSLDLNMSLDDDDDDSTENHHSMDYVELVENVDRRIVFRVVGECRV